MNTMTLHATFIVSTLLRIECSGFGVKWNIPFNVLSYFHTEESITVNTSLDRLFKVLFVEIFTEIGKLRAE